MLSYEFDFSSDDGNWTLIDAVIAGGVLDIDYGGWGGRHPDNDWGISARTDFEIHVKHRMTYVDPDYYDWYQWFVAVYLPDYYNINFWYRWSDDIIAIDDNDGTTQASLSVNLRDLNWHDILIRRVGTTYYFSVDGGTEISWNYGIASPLVSIFLQEGFNDGEYDDFVYKWSLADSYGFIL